ncbi:hypothetical protein AOLI_G00252280 [Acnodon oligacanthus]
MSKQTSKEGAGSDESEKVSLDGSVSLSKVHVHEDVMRLDGKAQDPGKELAVVRAELPVQLADRRAPLDG